MQIYRKIIHLHSHNGFICVDDNILDEGKMHYVKDQTSSQKLICYLLTTTRELEYMSMDELEEEKSEW